MAVTLLGLDYLTGQYFSFSSIYMLFVVAVSWTNGARTGVALALLTPVIRELLTEAVRQRDFNVAAFLSTEVSRMVSWSVIAVITARLAVHERKLRRERDVLVSLLPVCTYCHKIRSDAEGWESLDEYIAEHHGQFATGLCPECARSRFPEHFPPDLRAGAPPRL